MVASGSDRASPNTFNCVIGHDLKLSSDIVIKGNVRVQGEVLGNIRCGSLVIDENARVSGEVHCESVDISGEVGGSICCGNGVLKSTSRTDVDLYCKDWRSIRVERGAQIGGRILASDRLEHNALSLMRKLARRPRQRFALDQLAKEILLKNNLSNDIRPSRTSSAHVFRSRDFVIFTTTLPEGPRPLRICSLRSQFLS